MDLPVKLFLPSYSRCSPLLGLNGLIRTGSCYQDHVEQPVKGACVAASCYVLTTLDARLNHLNFLSSLNYKLQSFTEVVLTQNEWTSWLDCTICRMNSGLQMADLTTCPHLLGRLENTQFVNQCWIWKSGCNTAINKHDSLSHDMLQYSGWSQPFLLFYQILHFHISQSWTAMACCTVKQDAPWSCHCE